MNSKLLSSAYVAASCKEHVSNFSLCLQAFCVQLEGCFLGTLGLGSYDPKFHVGPPSSALPFQLVQKKPMVFNSACMQAEVHGEEEAFSGQKLRSTCRTFVQRSQAPNSAKKCNWRLNLNVCFVLKWHSLSLDHYAKWAKSKALWHGDWLSRGWLPRSCLLRPWSKSLKSSLCHTVRVSLVPAQNYSFPSSLVLCSLEPFLLFFFFSSIIFQKEKGNHCTSLVPMLKALCPAFNLPSLWLMGADLQSKQKQN